MMSSRFIRSLLLLIATSAFCWRFYDPNRDPAPVSASLSEVLDPAGYLYNARSFVLTGQWRAQSYGHIFRIAPGFALIAAAWMKIFGLGYGRIVLLSVVSGFVVIGCTAYVSEYVSWRREPRFPKGWARWFALWSLAISYVFLALQQVPKGDMESMAMTAVSALFLVSLDSPAKSRRLQLRSVAAGIGIGLAPFIKLHAAMFSLAALAAWALGWCVGDLEWRRTWRKATPFLLAGLALTAIVWIPWFWLTDVRNLAGTTLSAPFEQSVTAVPLGRLSSLFQSNLFYRHPVEIGLALLGIAICLRQVVMYWSLFFMTIWFGLGVAIFSVLTYSPTRYRLLFALPVVVLATQAWMSMRTGEWFEASHERSVVLTVAWIIFAVSEFLAIQFRFNLSWPIAPVLLAAVVMGIFLAWLCRCVPKRWWPAIAMVILAVMLAVSVPQWIRGERRDHVYQRLALSLVAHNPGIIFGGDIGCQLALWTNEDCSIDYTESATRPVTHLLIRESDRAVNAAEIPADFHESSRFTLPGVPEPVLLLTRANQSVKSKD